MPVFGDLVASLGGGHVLPYLSVIIAMSLFNVLGSLQNIESAEAAGDSYDTRTSLLINGVGSVAAALFGSAFPTTIYIGHPGWKALGARAGYSVLNGAFVTLICLTGTLAWIAWAIPIDAGMAIVLWIGIMIVTQAFQATPREHAPAVVIGLLPGIGAWGALMAKNGLRAAGVWGPVGPFGDPLIARVPEERHVDPRRLRPRAGLPLHRDDSFGGGRRRHRAPVERRGGVVRVRRGVVSYRTDAFLRLDVRRYGVEAGAGVAVRHRLRRHGGALLRRAVDHRGGRRTLISAEGLRPSDSPTRVRLRAKRFGETSP